MPASPPAELPLTAVRDPDVSFTKSMTRLRLARRWTVKRLAAESGVSEGTLFSLQARKSGPTLRTAWLIAEALEVAVDAMVRGDVP
jgi:transcriptional regulator with XRE-family HTH domain